MADIFSKEKRSEIMSRIKGKNTSLEREVFRLLRARGIRFQKHYARIPGKPDIALPKKKIAIFIDSDFWHGWRLPAWRRTLNPWWLEKIKRNRARDKRITRKLRTMGWKVIRIWEHNFKQDFQGTIDAVVEKLSSK